MTLPDPATLRRRGGTVRVRTKTLPNGKRLRVYVVRNPGPKGGRTVAVVER